MASVLDLVKHYQHNIEKYPQDEQKILKSIDKLFRLDVKVQHLQETGVGRTVNALRKEPGHVGQAARALVYKWKQMVAAEESDQEGDHNESSIHNGYEGGKDSDCSINQPRNREIQYDKSNSTPKSDQRDKQVNGDHSGSKRKYQSSEEEEPYIKKSKHSSSSERDDSRTKHVRPKSEPSETESHGSEGSQSENSDSEMSESSEEEKPPVKIKTEPVEKLRSPENSSHSNHNEIKKEPSSSKRSHDSSDKNSKRHSSESGHSEKSSSKEKSHSSHKEKIPKEKDSSSEKTPKEKDSSSEKKHKSDHKSSSSNKEKSHKEPKSSSMLSSEKHKSSSKKSDSGSERHKSHSEKSKSEKHSSSSSNKPEKEKHKSSSEKEIPIEKQKSKDSSSSSKDKISSSRKDKSKDRSSSSKEKSSSHKSDKKPSSSSEKSKSSDSKNRVEKSEERRSEKSSHKSSSSHKSKSGSSKSKEVPKNKPEGHSGDSDDDGIDCESGASFADVLGMMAPPKAKKKSTPLKDANSPNINCDMSPAALLAPTAKLAPLPALEISALPEISPNYKPRPPPKFLPHFAEEDAMSQVISSKNLRTKVYSGNKIIGKIPTLYEMCVQVLQEHIDALEYTGGVPYEILKPVVDKATPQQLFMLEHYNAYLMEDTDHLWQKHCEKHFRNKKRQEMETWREMFIRCQEEQEYRLKSLTANIRMTQEAKKAPIKQTKMAYVDSVVKPPRNIARKQALHGTAHAAAASPAARVAALAKSSNVLKGGVRPPNAAPVSSTALNKPKKAPLMQKALQFMRGRKR